MRTFFCSNCGSMIMPGLTQCAKCGMPLDGGPWVKKNVDKPLPKLVDVENADAPYMPYEPRPEQLQIISDISNSLDQRRHIVIESGTGTGKTIVSLAGALEHSKPRGKKIVYVTRTISQSDQVMDELKAINTLKPVSGITLTGRGKSCPLLSSRTDFHDLSPNVLSMMCSDHKQKSLQGKPGGCPYFDQVSRKSGLVEQYCKDNFPKSEELDVYCKNMKVCPYEAKKALLKDFDVVVAPYIHVIEPDIRDNLLQNLDSDPKGITLVVDEAHNLMDAVREQESFTMTDRLIGSARDEANMVKKLQVCEGVDIKDLMKAVVNALKALSTKHIPFGKTDALLPKDALEDFLCQTLDIPMDDLNTAVSNTVEYGEKLREATADADASSSPLLELSELLERWIRAPADRYVKIVSTGTRGASLKASCIDPSDIVRFMNSLDGAVHMSGTLRPLDQYAKVMGLPKNSVPRTYPSPFPKENLKVVYAKGVSTKYSRLKSDPNMMPRIERTIVQLCNTVDKNILVFFPSYRLMREARPYMEETLSKPLYWEESGRQRATMASLARFRNGRNGVFFCVMGGSVAEGMDFPGEELCFAIIVGIPYPPPSLENKAMADLFDAKYGRGTGWKYTSQIPAVRKMRQAIGRLIRTETDRGMAVILDDRASRDSRELGATPSDDPVGDAAKFFAGQC